MLVFGVWCGSVRVGGVVDDDDGVDVDGVFDVVDGVDVEVDVEVDGAPALRSGFSTTVMPVEVAEEGLEDGSASLLSLSLLLLLDMRARLRIGWCMRGRMNCLIIKGKRDWLAG